MIIFRRRDNLHEVKERLNFLLIFVVLGHPVRGLAARALKLTYWPIEMYGNGAFAPGKNVPQLKRARIPCILLLYVKRTISCKHASLFLSRGCTCI